MAYRAGSENGLVILLQGSQKEYICTSPTAGFKIVMHDATEHPFADTQGYIIAPGTSNVISVKKVCNTST